MSSLEEGDKLAASVAVAPRVTLADIERAIDRVYYVTADHAFCGHNAMQETMTTTPGASEVARDLEISARLATLTLCCVVLHNGYSVIGKSAPADARNFNASVGRRFAKDDAMRQLWPILGHMLCEDNWRRDEAQAEGELLPGEAVARAMDEIVSAVSDPEA